MPTRPFSLSNKSSKTSFLMILCILHFLSQQISYGNATRERRKQKWNQKGPSVVKEQLNPADVRPKRFHEILFVAKGPFFLPLVVRRTVL